MVRIKRIGRRRLAFVAELFKNGGNGRAAAIAAGYSPKSAAVTAHHLLRDDHVAALVVAGFEREPNGQVVFARLISEGRSAAITRRIALLLKSEAPAAVVTGSPDAPMVAFDDDDKTLRDYLTAAPSSDLAAQGYNGGLHDSGATPATAENAKVSAVPDAPS